MSESGENITDGQLDFSVDDETQLQPEDTLDIEDIADVLDRGYCPPDSPRGSTAFGTTAWEQSQHETIDQRIRQEEPDPYSAYGAPHNESGLNVERVGGDDPDAIDPDEDWIGGPQVGAVRAGRLVAPDHGSGADVDDELVGWDAGVDGAAASAEEAAVHIIRDDALSDDE